MAIGSGLCGAIRYRLDGALRPSVTATVRAACAGAASHATSLFVGADPLRIKRGEDRVNVFNLPGAARFGQIFRADGDGEAPRLSAIVGRSVVPAGSLEGDPGIRPRPHIFVGSKASWDVIADSLPQFEAAAP